MGNQLLIRAYNVGCGDCIYVRIPKGADGFHILIDCGKKGGTELLREAVSHIEENLLPKGSKPGKKRLDLIVATHRHEDHIKGFNPEWFQNIEVRNVWLSAGMNPAHPQAKKTNALHSLATNRMRSLVRNSRSLSPQVELLASLYGVSNDEADDFLMRSIPKANGIAPRFVYAGMTGSKLGLDLPSETEIHVLGPEKDIDGFYLGEEADASLRGVQEIGGSFRAEASASPAAMPTNISAEDFRKLQSRMLSNGLAFAAKDTSIQNNLSVVLLIVWQKRRLLFVGDAEWEGNYREGKHNGSWNVMWEKRRNLLDAPVDFLKVGHHGSINATPPPPTGKASEQDAGSVFRILDAILPPPAKGKKPTSKAIVSTEREFYNPIPECKLLVEVARRVSNTCNYGPSLTKKRIDPAGIWVSEKAKTNRFFEKYEKAFLNEPQPLRTDLEFWLNKSKFVDVEIDRGGTA